MKPGDIVRLKEELYPQYKGKVGVLIQSQDSCVVGQAEYWAVMVDGHIHPFGIIEDDILEIT